MLKVPDQKFTVHPVRVSKLTNISRFYPGSPQNDNLKGTKVKTRSAIWQGIKNTWFEYAEMTKVNGMYYLRRNVTSGLPRIIWTIIITTLFSLAGVLLFFFWRKYVTFPTRVNVASPMTTLQVPFPAITICHPQSVMDYKIEKFMNNVKLPPGGTKKAVWDALPIIGVFTEHKWTRPNKKEVKLVHDFLTLNNISVVDAINTLGMTCEDFILVCQWAGKRFPCFQSDFFLSWTASMSHFGACCSFNYHIYPKENDSVIAANTYGIHGGVSIIGTGSPQASDGKSGAIYSEGFMLMIHHPNDFAVEASPLTLLKLGRETFVSVYPTDMKTSEQALQLPQHQRHCATPRDFNPPKNYRNPACMLECLTDAVHEKCQCHPFHLPKKMDEGPAIRDCTVMDAFCFSENYCEYSLDEN